MSKTHLFAFIGLGVLLVLAALWYFVFSSTSGSVEETGPVAVVNGEEVSRDAFETFRAQALTEQNIDSASLDAESRAQLDVQIVEELVSQRLLEQAVAASGADASPDEVDARLEAAAAQFGGEEAFVQALAAEGISEEDLRAQIRADVVAMTYLEQELGLSSITVTEQEIEETYAQVAAQGDEVPPLSEVRTQLEQSILQQKQQALFAQHIEQLRSEAEVEILL